MPRRRTLGTLAILATILVCAALLVTADAQETCPPNLYKDSIQNIVVPSEERADALAVVFSGDPFYTYISGPTWIPGTGCHEVWFEASVKYADQ